MLRSAKIRTGILCAVLPWLTISCGTKTATQPGLSQALTAIPTTEEFLTSAQQEHRELLVDGRATPVEWNTAGAPDFVLMQGTNGGGDFLLSLRSVWSYDRFGAPQGIYFLLQWPDPSQSVLYKPIVNDSVDIFDDQGIPEFDGLSDPRLTRPTSWHRGTSEEDQVVIEIFSDSLGSYPADNWRWGAATTDPVFPTSNVEFVGAVEDTLGQTTHPAAGFMEDRYDQGGGPVDDVGRITYSDNFQVFANGIVPDSIASKGVRDTRLNRGKPTAYTIWGHTPPRPLTVNDVQNPIRVDDSSLHDKSWNPGDYVPSVIIRFPTLSQLSVLARGNWVAGKWNLEVRRDLISFDKRADVNGNDPSTWVPWPDDIPLVPGRHYAMRVTIYDASSTRASRSPLIPLYLRPR
jgi:hypothetical protein